MNLQNFHTHTNFCDGLAAPEEFVAEAIRQGFSVLGFSGHAPVPFSNSWSIKTDNLQNYCQAISNLKALYKNELIILLGLEIDFISGFTRSFDDFRQQCMLDYTIGSVHFVKHPEKKALWFIDGPEKGYLYGINEIFEQNARLAVESYYDQLSEMISTQQPQIIGHIDKVVMYNRNRFFSEGEAWYRQAAENTLKFAKKHGCMVEVNTRGIYSGKASNYFPGDFILQKCLELDIPMILSSDAHQPSEISCLFEEFRNHLKSIGFKKLMGYDISSKEFVAQAL